MKDLIVGKVFSLEFVLSSPSIGERVWFAFDGMHFFRAAIAAVRSAADWWGVGLSNGVRVLEW